MDPLRVLIVEESEHDANLVAHELRRTGRSIDFERVEDATSMRAALERGAWDVVVSDWSTPRCDALAALGLLKGLGVDLPFIIVSGDGHEELAVEAMRAGAHDYVHKSDITRLAPAVERELRESEARAGRRRAEAALRASEARFRAMIERSEEGISLSARDGTTLYLSPAAERIVGYTSAERVGRNRREFVHPEDLARAQAIRADLDGRPGESITYEMRVQRSDGLCRWLEVIETNLLDVEEVGAIVSNFRDVTEKRGALDALRASEARYRGIVETTNEGVWTIDANARTTFMNARMARILGYEADQAAGLLPLDCLNEESRQRLLENLPHLKSGAAEQIEVPFKRGDGTTVWTLLESSPILDAAGRYEGALAMVMDITELKRSEERLRRTEDQLRQAQKMESVGRLAGGVAHDFNNVLTVILSLASYMLDELGPGEPMRDDAEEILKAGQRAADLTRQLLLFSRQQVLEPQVIDLNELLARMDRMLRRIVSEDIELMSLPGAASGRVRADPSSIEQVVMNLVVNARDAMPKGGKLTIETANVELDEDFAREHHGVRAGSHVMLAVSDTGVGMDKATIARIFEPFFTTKEKGKGTGLGLSTVFGIVQQSGGSVWVYSEPGRGTSFKVYLPRVAGSPETAGRLLRIRPEMHVVFMSGYTDDSIVRHGVLDAALAFIQKPLTPEALARKVREVLDAPRAG